MLDPGWIGLPITYSNPPGRSDLARHARTMTRWSASKMSAKSEAPAEGDDPDQPAARRKSAQLDPKRVRYRPIGNWGLEWNRPKSTD